MIDVSLPNNTSKINTNPGYWNCFNYGNGLRWMRVRCQFPESLVRAWEPIMLAARTVPISQQLQDAWQSDELAPYLSAEHPEQLLEIDARVQRLWQHIQTCRRSNNNNNHNYSSAALTTKKQYAIVRTFNGTVKHLLRDPTMYSSIYS